MFALATHECTCHANKTQFELGRWGWGVDTSQQNSRDMVGYQDTLPIYSLLWAQNLWESSQRQFCGYFMFTVVALNLVGLHWWWLICEATLVKRNAGISMDGEGKIRTDDKDNGEEEWVRLICLCFPWPLSPWQRFIFTSWSTTLAPNAHTAKICLCCTMWHMHTCSYNESCVPSFILQILSGDLLIMNSVPHLL